MSREANNNGPFISAMLTDWAVTATTVRTIQTGHTELSTAAGVSRRLLAGAISAAHDPRLVQHSASRMGQYGTKTRMNTRRKL